MIKTDPKLISKLEKNALWLVMHPVITFDEEIHQVYPWLRSETINFSRKIEYYLRDVRNKAISAPTPCIRFFNNYENITTYEQLTHYMSDNTLDCIVYCGFHYGYCILNEQEVGVRRMSKKYKCYVKHDLCQIAWEAEWGDRDRATSEVSTII